MSLCAWYHGYLCDIDGHEDRGEEILIYFDVKIFEYRVVEIDSHGSECEHEPSVVTSIKRNSGRFHLVIDA